MGSRRSLMVLSEFAADSTHRVGVVSESQVCIL